MITLRPYQKEALEKLEGVLKLKDEVVLASSPSSGKTVMAIDFIKRMVGKKFLILTYGQNLLKDMWERELYIYLTEEELARVEYGLPQSIHKKDIPVVDYVIVDEAHELTFASMVQKILEKNKMAKKIYLTGTPSRFILRKYDVIIIPAIELIRQGYISDLYVGLISTKVRFRDNDRNKKTGDLANKAQKKLESSVESDMASLLDAMVKRLSVTSKLGIKKGPYKSQLAGWVPITDRLGKTMIACESVVQARKVAKFLEEKGVSVISSNSIDDPHSENIRRFQEDGEITVLVVVDRGILGFNMPNLVNVVDMTCSRNINRIYQLYARVMRKSDDHPDKFFFKLSPEDEMFINKFYMEASLCLMYEYFISRYNGKNLDTTEIPAVIKKRARRSSKGSGKGRRSSVVTVDPLMFETVKAAQLMESVFNKIDRDLNEYAMVRFSKIKREAFGKDVVIDWSSPDTIVRDMMDIGLIPSSIKKIKDKFKSIGGGRDGV